MQQTKNYNLNLIEMADTFSPAPLNENMETLEAALGAETAARQSADSALGRRVSILEGRRIATGTYAGDGTNNANGQTIYLGFAPKAVLVQPRNYSAIYLGVEGNSSTFIKILSSGFQLLSTYVNSSSNTYIYFAIS